GDAWRVGMSLWVLFFFFSSRRRHTILVSDWSSDVCSSDLGEEGVDQARLRGEVGAQGLRAANEKRRPCGLRFVLGAARLSLRGEIGRASCRERGEGGGAGV